MVLMERTIRPTDIHQANGSMAHLGIYLGPSRDSPGKASPFSALEQVDDLCNQSSEDEELRGQCRPPLPSMVFELADDIDDQPEIRK
jgi:hypothetical protein